MNKELWLYIKSGFLALFILGLGLSFFAFGGWLLILVMKGLE